MTPALSLVPDAVETAAQAAKRLQQEAATQANTAVEELLALLNQAEAAAGDVADLKAAPNGIREEARQLRDQIAWRASTIITLQGRK